MFFKEVKRFQIQEKGLFGGISALFKGLGGPVREFVSLAGQKRLYFFTVSAIIIDQNEKEKERKFFESREISYDSCL